MRFVENAKIKKKKRGGGGKGKVKIIYSNEILTSAGVVYFSLTLSDQVFNNFFFYYVRSLSDVDECSEAHPVKIKEIIAFSLLFYQNWIG